MATNYNINYDDKRFTEVEADKRAALNEVDVTYGNMINSADKYYQKQIDAAQDWADKQSQLQQERTDFTIEQIEQQKAQATKDYTKEQSGAYVDWQKQSNQYGANAEAMAAQGMAGSGYSESSQVSMYNTYQNRVASARESYNQAILNYNNAIKDARLQNNSVLAEIAYQALQTQLELSLEGFQYKNQLIIEKSNKRMEVDNNYYNRYQDVLKQINTENALAEEVRQYNESLAEERRQFNAELSLAQAELAEKKRQFNAEQAAKAAVAPKGGGGGGGGSSSKRGASNPNYSVNRNKTQKSGSTKVAEPTVSNRHGDSWVEIPGHGRFSWTEVYAYVKDGTVKETKSGNTVKYTWVGKKSTYKNVTPDAKGYAAKQKDLLMGRW